MTIIRKKFWKNIRKNKENNNCLWLHHLDIATVKITANFLQALFNTHYLFI